MEDFEEENPDSDIDDTEYADLPDLSELEMMIDWDDIKDFDGRPAKSNQNSSGTDKLDINSV